MGRVIDVEPARFEEMVAEALDGLPEGLGRLMQNVAVTVEHGPGPHGLLGLYQGIPLTSRTSQYAGVLPDRITIYRRAICAICRTEPEVANQVRRTVIHEVAHHFGIDDNRLRELGWLVSAGARLAGLRMLDHRVGSGKDEPRVAVVELHHVGRLALAAAHLDDLAGLVLVPDNVAVNADAVAYCRLHSRVSSLRRELCLPAGSSSLGVSRREAMRVPHVS